MGDSYFGRLYGVLRPGPRAPLVKAGVGIQSAPDMESCIDMLTFLGIRED
ncbi:hypothetical protein I7I50_00804 [Histoplasma capsulatum G186AR]|uniref:Uncharacterized protein n=1 Tax=Ajellomyces capsulatus TaxID=5037 RepID=A0A8H7YJF9_AJECA|nr:hypothetical protein I7I52_08072 [Histoplasma capsulatum]QSS72834.1 hypothetical protein I7I50_00804 [Histoplasma capsulatum G186AR]